MGIPKEMIKNIKAMYESGYSCAKIAVLFRLSESKVRAIVNH